VLTQKLILRSLWYCSRTCACINIRPFEKGAERSCGRLDAWSEEAVLRASHEQTRHAGGCDGTAALEAEDVGVLRRDPNAIVRERQRRAWLRYGVEG
jgi:hypothetical protein